MKTIIHTLQTGFCRFIAVNDWFINLFPSFHEECDCIEDDCMTEEACCCCACCCC